MARRVFASLGQNACELFNLEPLSPGAQGVEYTFSNENCLSEVLSRKGAKVFLTAHTGNWELLGLLARHYNIPLAAIGAQTRSSLLRPVLEWIRRKTGVRTLWRGKNGAKEVLSALDAGISVAGVIDQDTRVRGLAVPYFGRLAYTPCTLVKLALEKNIPLYSVFIFRDRAQTFQVLLEPLPGRCVEEILGLYNARLEAGVRVFPEQWVWFHKRWRTLPDGTRLSNAEYSRILTQRT
jgi:KDO2-lipid IV(A) lauroyltransferase